MRVCSCHRLVRLLFPPNAIVWLPASAFPVARERTCRLERRWHSTCHCSAAHVAEAEERREQHKEANACKQIRAVAPTRAETCVGKKGGSGNAMRWERLLKAPQPHSAAPLSSQRTPPLSLSAKRERLWIGNMRLTTCGCGRRERTSLATAVLFRLCTLLSSLTHRPVSTPPPLLFSYSVAWLILLPIPSFPFPSLLSIRGPSHL